MPRKKLRRPISASQGRNQTNIDAGRARLSKIGSEVLDIQNELAGLEISAVAPGVAIGGAPCVRVPVNLQFQVISQGQLLLLIMPDTEQQAVKLIVNDLDAALIFHASRVRVEFDGWPAIQLSGCQNVAIGTFAGKVVFVDASNDGTGGSRVMVLPDETLQKWPS